MLMFSSDALSRFFILLSLIVYMTGGGRLAVYKLRVDS